MPNAMRPDIEIISVEEFKALVQDARDQKVEAGMKLAKPELHSAELGRGLKVPIYTTDADMEMKILHTEEAAVVAAIDDTCNKGKCDE